MFLRSLAERLGLTGKKSCPAVDPLRTSLEKLLGFSPNHIETYKLAFLHKSVVTTDGEGHRLNNERLEYLGDAVLEAAVSDILYNMFPTKGEGYLTGLRSKIVQRETLNQLSVDMGIKEVMNVPLVSHSHNVNVFGNAFEALIGAIYIDKGYPYVMSFLNDNVFKTYLDIKSLSQVEQNFKSRLLEWGHRYRVSVVFDTQSVKKDKYNMMFHSSVLLNGVSVADGEGYTKRSSHQEAAHKALNLIRGDKDLVDRIRNKEKH